MKRKTKKRVNQHQRQQRNIHAMKTSQKPKLSVLDSFIESGEFDRAMHQILEKMAGEQ